MKKLTRTHLGHVFVTTLVICLMITLATYKFFGDTIALLTSICLLTAFTTMALSGVENIMILLKEKDEFDTDSDE